MNPKNKQEEKRVLTNFEALQILAESKEEDRISKFIQFYKNDGYTDDLEKLKPRLEKLTRLGLDNMEILQILNNYHKMSETMLYLILHDIDARFEDKDLDEILEICKD